MIERLCYYCGLSVLRYASMDHIVPRSKGGKSTPDTAEYRMCLQNEDWTHERMFATAAKLRWAVNEFSQVLHRLETLPPGTSAKVVKNLKRKIHKLQHRMAVRKFFQRRAIEIHEKYYKSKVDKL